MALDRFFAVDLQKSTPDLSWAVKHAPKTLDQVDINKTSIEFVHQWYQTNRNVPDQLLFVVGPNGCGKSVGTMLALRSAGASLVIKDVHEERNKQVTEEIADMLSLESPNTCIVLENVDMNAKGVVDLIKERYTIQLPKKGAAAPKRTPVQPGLVVITNNTYGTVNGVLGIGSVVRFSQATDMELEKVARRVYKAEKKEYPRDLVMGIIKRCVGDAGFLLNQIQFAALTKGSFTATKRLEHHTVFDACDDILNVPKLGIHRGSYLASLDNQTVLCLLFENYTNKSLPLKDLSTVARDMSDAELLSGSKLFQMSEVSDVMVYAPNRIFGKSKKIGDLKFPTMFSKSYTQSTNKNHSVSVRTHMQQVTHTAVPVHWLGSFVVQVIESKDWDTLTRIIQGYKLNSDHVASLCKISNLKDKKFTIKAEAKRVIEKAQVG